MRSITARDNSLLRGQSMGQSALIDAIKRGFLLPRINEFGTRIYSQILK